jgi:uncharacterized membrane protein YebE (DUF533 family)
MGRQLLLLLLGFAGGTAIALLLGAKNLGTAIGVGQVCFAAVLVYVLMRDRIRESASPDNSGEGPERHSPESP